MNPSAACWLQWVRQARHLALDQWVVISLPCIIVINVHPADDCPVVTSDTIWDLETLGWGPVEEPGSMATQKLLTLMMAASLKCPHTSTSFLSVTKSNACNECGALSPRSYVLSVCLLGLVNPLHLPQLECCIVFPSYRMLYVSKCSEIQNLIFLQSSGSLLHLTPPRPTKSIWPWLIIVTKAVQENMHVRTVRQIRSQQGGGWGCGALTPVSSPQTIGRLHRGSFWKQACGPDCGWWLTATTHRTKTDIQGKIEALD